MSTSAEGIFRGASPHYRPEEHYATWGVALCLWIIGVLQCYVAAGVAVIGLVGYLRRD